MKQFLGAEVLKGIDKTFQQRAARLMADAEKGAKRKKPGVALRQWANELDGWDVADVAGTGVSGFGSAAAGAAIAGAGIAAGAVTFFIGPAIGLAVGLTVSKGIAEVKYQRASDRLRRAIKRGPDPSVFPMDNLHDGMSKVLKKYLRVARRAKMLRGGLGGKLYNLRHLKTTIAAQMGPAAKGPKKISTKYNDRDLNERLLEFRYYGQMTLNTLNAHLNTVVDAYRNVLDQAGTTHVHILRQVHFAGNHGNCGVFGCYNMDQEEFRRSVEPLRPAPAKGNFLTREYHKAEHFKAVRADLKKKRLPENMAAYPNRPVSTISTNNLIANIATAQHRNYQGTPTSMSDLIEPVQRGIEYAMDVAADAATGGATKDSAFVDGVSQWAGELGEAGEPMSDAMGGVAANAGIGLGLDIVFSAVKERVDRRKARSRVLGNKKNIAKLLEGEHQIMADEMKPLIELIQSDDKAHAMRVVDKIVSYGEKIHNLENDRDYIRLRDKVNTVDFSYSVFSSCDEAHASWKCTHYIVRQYIKFITNLVFLEIILMQLDRKLATMDIGITQGQLIAEGVPTPIRPAHMKDIDD
jgi:hypothetical protein